MENRAMENQVDCLVTRPITSWHRLLRWLRPLLLAIVLSSVLTVGTTLLHLGDGPSRVAFACGLGNSPTMDADNAPALLYPTPVGVSYSHPMGIFALQFVAGQPVAFAEDLSRVPGAPPLSSLQIRWTFGDGTAVSTAVSPTHTFAHPGTYDIYLQQYDAVSTPPWDDIDSAQIAIIAAAPTNPPVARITASATSTVVDGNPQDASITFDATGSHSLDGSPLKYLWNFNDANTATGPHVTHAFAMLGAGFVALIVTDGHGASSVATINVGIVSDKQQLPTASLSASATSVQPGQRVSFDASQSSPASEPAGDQLTRYVWDFGDGTPAQTTQMPTNTHVFQQAGQYRVAVQAIDQQETPAQAIVTVVVAAAAREAPSSASTGPNWLLLGGIAVLLLLGGAGAYYALGAQQRNAARARGRAGAWQPYQGGQRLTRAQPHNRPGPPPRGYSRAGMPGPRHEVSGRRDTRRS